MLGRRASCTHHDVLHLEIEIHRFVAAAIHAEVVQVMPRLLVHGDGREKCDLNEAQL